MPFLVPKTWWHSQVVSSMKYLPSSLFPHFIPACLSKFSSHPTSYSSLSTHLALLMQLKIVFFTFTLGEWHNLYTSLRKNSHAQCFLQTRHWIYIWTAFSVSVVFWEKDTSILNIRALIHFYNLLLQMLQTMGNLW